eukprot:GFKZ01014849.1.p2 GENE.GFKZ01014849.1~~GFKZ01014849.1.p2  ORF type:complete len:102 (-),score=2.36 GFKZ01014849.1:463-768(-)
MNSQLLFRGRLSRRPKPRPSPPSSNPTPRRVSTRPNHAPQSESPRVDSGRIPEYAEVKSDLERLLAEARVLHNAVKREGMKLCDEALEEGWAVHAAAWRRP